MGASPEGPVPSPTYQLCLERTTQRVLAMAFRRPCWAGGCSLFKPPVGVGEPGPQGAGG